LTKRLSMAVPALKRKTGRKRLLTVGYEGRTVHWLIRLLTENAVGVLVDVREVPLSRKPGFSKAGLERALANAGIQYVHIGSLGSPRDARIKLHKDGDYRAFFQAYGTHLQDQEEALRQVHELLSEASICLMCYEAQPGKCHRIALAAVLERSHEVALEVVHR